MAQLDGNGIIGMNSWKRPGVSQRQVAKASGVDEAKLSKVRHGKAGLSVKAARALEPQAEDVNAPALYVSSQAVAIAKQRDAGEITNGEVIVNVGRVIKTLDREFTTDEVNRGGEVLKAGYGLLSRLLDGAGGVPGRSSTGLSKKKITDPKPKTAKKETGRTTAAGFKRRKIV